jgi:hypothetical protein
MGSARWWRAGHRKPSAAVQRNRVIPFTLMAFATFVVGFSLVRAEWSWRLLDACWRGTHGDELLGLTSSSLPCPDICGREMALLVMAFVGIMPFSALIFGPLGQVIGPSTAVLGAGVVLLAWSALLAARPGWLRMAAAPESR